MNLRIPHPRALLHPVIRPLPVHPILLAAYAVLYLYAANVAQVSLEDALPPLLVVVLATLALLIVGTVVVRDARRVALVLSAGVALFFGFGHVANALAPLHVSGKFQLAGWFALLAVAALAAWRLRDRLPAVTIGLNVAAAVLLVLPLVTILPYELSRLTHSGRATGAVSARNAPPPGARDIYFLVFDRYGSNPALRYHFGLESNDLPDWLASRGFYVAKQSHANYAMTALSLAATLNMRYLDDLTAQYGRTTDDMTPTYQLMKNNAVGSYLRDHGYRYVHMGSWWTPTKRADIADTVYQWSAESEFSAALRETTVLPYVAQRLGIRSQPTFPDAARRIALYEFATLPKIRDLPGPKFVVAHILLPHPPYVFRADGSPVSTPDCRSKPIGGLFRDQLSFTNSHIKPLVDELLSGPEASRPIVIIQADEGPKPLRADIDWSKKRTEALNVRHGILNAMYLPGLSQSGLYQTITPVNTFRLVFARYFSTDLPLLPDRSYTFPPGHAYDFTDITDLLRPSVLEATPPPPPGPAISPANADQICGRAAV